MQDLHQSSGRTRHRLRVDEALAEEYFRAIFRLHTGRVCSVETADRSTSPTRLLPKLQLPLHEEEPLQERVLTSRSSARGEVHNGRTPRDQDGSEDRTLTASKTLHSRQPTARSHRLSRRAARPAPKPDGGEKLEQGDYLLKASPKRSPKRNICEPGAELLFRSTFRLSHSPDQKRITAATSPGTKEPRPTSTKETPEAVRQAKGSRLEMWHLSLSKAKTQSSRKHSAGLSSEAPPLGLIHHNLNHASPLAA